jgi:NAD(P)-dependent dehydrogenase (short-subunit alcohol dehydrogenase family)
VGASDSIIFLKQGQNLQVIIMSENRVVFLTGASKGLGENIRGHLLASGFKVFATARNIPDSAKKTNTDQIIWHSLDISSYTQCETAINSCLEKFGHIDILINNASACTGGVTIADIPHAGIDTEIDTTFKGAVYLSKIFIATMRERKQGKIFFISSTSGLAGEPGNKFYSIYAASKAALIRYSECLNQDISQYNMQSHVIVPCNMRSSNFEREDAVSYSDVSDLLIKMINIGDNISLSQVILRPAITHNT